MPDKAQDEELRTGLTQARKKPRNYLLIAKGSTAVKLIVQKKPIKAAEVQRTKAEVKGSLVVEGVCQGDGTEMIFQVLGDEPSIKTLSIKELIAEQADLTLKPRFQVVTQLETVDESDEEGNAAPEGQATTTTPPAPPPPPPTQDAVAKAIAQLTAAMNKLSPIVQAAVAANPARKGELAKSVATFQAQLQGNEVEAAKATLLALGTLAKELAAATSAAQGQVPPAQPADADAPADSKAAAWTKAWGPVDEQYNTAIKTASSDLASKMRVLHAYASEQAEAGQFDKALAALARLRPLIEQAAAGQGAAGEVAAGTVEKRKFLVERFRVLAGEIRSELDRLKGAISRQVPDEDSDELCSEIDDALGFLFDELQDEIDAAINAGDMSVLAGLKRRVTGNELISHLAKNPLVDGAPFQQLVLDAIEELETKLAS